MKSWHLSGVVENLTEEQAGELLDTIVQKVEELGTCTGASIHPFGDVEKNEECLSCLRQYRLPVGTFGVESPLLLRVNDVLVGS